MATRILLLFLVVLFTGCAGQSASPASSSTPSPSPAKTEIVRYQTLLEALRMGGATVEPGENVEQPFFHVPGKIVRVNGQDVQVFEYENEAARQADSSQISPDGSAIGTNQVTWIDTPHFWAKGTIIALYIGQNQETIDQINQVLGNPITTP